MLSASLLGNLNLSGLPDGLFDKYTDFCAGIWSEPEPGQRALSIGLTCIEAIHGIADERREALDVELLPTELAQIRAFQFAGFTAEEQIVLALADLIPFRHHEISDEQVVAAQEAFGPRGAVVLLVALAFFDVNCRLKLTGGVDVHNTKD